MYGTIDFTEIAEVEGLPLSQAFDPEGRTPGGQDLASEGVRQTLLRKHCLFQL